MLLKTHIFFEGFAYTFHSIFYWNYFVISKVILYTYCYSCIVSTAAVSWRIGFPSGTVFSLQRSSVRRWDCRMAPLLRRGEPVHANVCRLQRPSGRNGPEGARWHQVQTGIIGYVHRRRVSGKIQKWYIVCIYQEWLTNQYHHEFESKATLFWIFYNLFVYFWLLTTFFLVDLVKTPKKLRDRSKVHKSGPPLV